MSTVIDPGSLFVAADSASRAGDWDTLWALREPLSRTDLWLDFYGPACAVAGWHVDREAGQVLLDELIAAGFHQPEMFAEEFSETFALEDGWAQRLCRMQANVPPPPIELLEWPDYAPTLEPVLDRLPADRETRLRDRVPSPAGSAWQTAVQLLDWVTTRWEHANAHLERRDALELLDRVEAGERFACVEYTILLSQALNAVGIPSRSLSLLMRDHHTGAGRGHVVTEAWIDDLGRWVLLDGQNGAWWGEESAPLGVLELMQLYDAGDRPTMNSNHHHLDEQDQATWFWYFAAAKTTGLAWSRRPFVPTFQTSRVVEAARLVQGSVHVAPDLARIGTGVVDTSGPALTFTPVHPYAKAVRIQPAWGKGETTEIGPGEAFALEVGPGTHAFEVATVTPFSTLAASPLRFVHRGERP